ncbi:MAG: response regulator [Proteobacteria bacterium]|nr:response regulator [Pseudomonadota bacterium]MBU4257932.1 response regulator [Pseudomonadota bacterium]MBU4287005.1 response regulator [Pseudomonadota bacterium]MBU4414727.1 response regulator [Pseudomonadota bacterium]MCG2759441.1 response regulator [Desulfobacteraceae bacterium]
MTAQILIVDDELDILTVLAMIIKDKTDHKVTTTNNPFEVPELIKEGTYDLLIADLKMPGMDGIELMGEVKKLDEHIPILIITAYGSPELAEKSIHKGAYDYITKPFRKEQILIAINRALEWQAMDKEIRRLKDKAGE